MLLALHINILAVFVSLGGYQLFLLLTHRRMKDFPEGYIKYVQYGIGIPTLGILIVFLFDPHARGFEFVTIAPQVAILGTAIFNSAALMICWAHVSLGEFWTCDLGTRSDHHLVESGLYRWIRHPLYANFILLAVGLFLMTGDWLVGLSVLAYVTAVAARARKEEEMLLGRLGQSYASYMQRTGRFLPRFVYGSELAKVPIMLVRNSSKRHV
jgi:protein-S-isoprenylcysteine O-methyltransferase Ste14